MIIVSELIPGRHERKGRPARDSRQLRKSERNELRRQRRDRLLKVAALSAVLASLVLLGLQVADEATRSLQGLPPRQPALLAFSRSNRAPYMTLELFGRRWPP